MRHTTLVLAALGLCLTARADIVVPGANGSDGAFAPTEGKTIDLSLAPTASWDSVSPIPGNGVYDPEKWAVVFHYTSVDIPAGVTITFKNNATRAPVVWLVSGNVNVAGSLLVEGVYVAGGPSGPGGFRARVGSHGGLGPGGSAYGGTGSYATPGAGTSPGKTYGNFSVVPLIGGSTAGRGPTGNDWAAGGAILVVATGTISVSGTVSAAGMYDSSGGAIRLVADAVAGSGSLTAVALPAGSRGGAGRIRVEANSIDPLLTCTPVASGGRPGAVAKLWPTDSEPSVRIVSVGGEAMPADPRAEFNTAADVFPDPLLTVVPVVIETKNVPTSAIVNLRVAPLTAEPQLVQAVFTSGDASVALWTASITPPLGTTVLQVRVEAP